MSNADKRIELDVSTLLGVSNVAAVARPESRSPALTAKLLSKVGGEQPPQPALLAKLLSKVGLETSD